jgi:polyhydroxyalkanoate synthesis regulator phasin
LEHLVEEQRKDLETQNSSRLTGIYDEDDGIVVTGEMLEEEEMKVHQLEERIKSMQDQVNMLHSDA